MPGHPGTPTSVRDAARARAYAVPVVHEICPIHPPDRGHALCRALRAHGQPADASANGRRRDGSRR